MQARLLYLTPSAQNIFTFSWEEFFPAGLHLAVVETILPAQGETGEQRIR